MSGLRPVTKLTTCVAGPDWLQIVYTVRFSLDWRRILSAWALVLILILAGFGVKAIVPSLRIVQTTGPELRGARIPQFDPFDLGPPAFEDEGDTDTEAHSRK
jgi:hypothetical protein